MWRAEINGRHICVSDWGYRWVPQLRGRCAPDFAGGGETWTGLVIPDRARGS
jgi:hypothetical protein